MKVSIGLSAPVVLLAWFSLSLSATAQTGCSHANGNRFNLEPRANAVVQVAQSVAVLPGGVEPGIDLIVTSGIDARGLSTNLDPTLFSADAFYVQRSAASCTPDLEGGEPEIDNLSDSFISFGTPTVVADPARRAFFMADLRFGIIHDDNGVGIIRTSAANLLNPATCPSGTEVQTVPCWALGAVANITSLNAFLANPHIAVDPRTNGTGAGDVYTVVTQTDPSGNGHTGIFLTACTNATINCGRSIRISGIDSNADFAWVQVRPDGGITVSYRNTTFPGINPEDLKFVNCTPNGAPAAPTCSAAILVTTESNPVFASLIGDVPMDDQLYPRHTHRLENDGTTVTTFLVYDRCDVPIIQQVGLGDPFCPKVDVVMTSSNDGGNSWSPVTKVTSSKGQQFYGTVATDVSTGTVHIAYYSTQNDSFQQQAQIFLVQVAPGSTSVGTPQLLTTATADLHSGSPLFVFEQPLVFGDRIGLAAVGTGKAGQSHAYVTYTWNSAPGTYGGISSPDLNNHLTLFEY